MLVGIIRLEIFLPVTNSLKAKRRIISSFVKRMRNIYNVAVREIGFFNLWQRSLISIVFISLNSKEFDISLQKITNFIYNFKDFEVINIEQERL